VGDVPRGITPARTSPGYRSGRARRGAARRGPPRQESVGGAPGVAGAPASWSGGAAPTPPRSARLPSRVAVRSPRRDVIPPGVEARPRVRRRIRPVAAGRVGAGEPVRPTDRRRPDGLRRNERLAIRRRIAVGVVGV